MGLDTSHDCWHGSYSAFSRFRGKLAEVAGYAFDTQSPRCVQIDWGGISRVIGDNLTGRWPSVPVRHDGTPDPLIVLLAHSDFEGEIQEDMCGPLADRIESLIPLLGDEDGMGHVGVYADSARRFVDGLRKAASTGEPVVFN
jgi:hypothetical protein